jgi:fumarate reductase subunit C
MTFGDTVNGLYEMLGGLFLLYNCFVLYKHKQVRGISAVPVAFFTTWGIWNLWYYPSLNQWLSFSGGCLIVVANMIWITMMIYYVRKEKSLTTQPK